MQNRQAGFILILFLYFIVFKAIAASNYDRLTQINQLQQQAIDYYTGKGNYKNYESRIYAGATVKGNLDLAVDCFNHAYQLAPDRLDLALSIASIQVLHGDLGLAENSYRSMEEKTPNNPLVLAFETAYALAWGESSEYLYYLQKLDKLSIPGIESYVSAIKIAENSFTMSINHRLPVTASSGQNMAIVILGYALNADGSMDKKLIDRLKAGLLAARAYPQAKIIVSGGVPQGGVTEAFVMQKWLRINGISADRIILEDKSQDTMFNALNSVQIIASLKVNKILLVTSENHIRRAVAVFREAMVINDLNVSVDNLTAEDSTFVGGVPSEIERALIARDVLRTAGLWALPGMVR